MSPVFPQLAKAVGGVKAEGYTENEIARFGRVSDGGTPRSIEADVVGKSAGTTIDQTSKICFHGESDGRAIETSAGKQGQAFEPLEDPTKSLNGTEVRMFTR